MKVLIPGAWPSLEPISVETLPPKQDAGTPKPLPKPVPRPPKQRAVAVDQYPDALEVAKEHKQRSKRLLRQLEAQHARKRPAQDDEHRAKRIRVSPSSIKREAPKYLLTRKTQKFHNGHQPAPAPPQFRREKEYPGKMAKKYVLAHLARGILVHKKSSHRTLSLRLQQHKHKKPRPDPCPQVAMPAVEKPRKQPAAPHQPKAPTDPEHPSRVHYLRPGYSSDLSMPDEFVQVSKLGSAGEGSVYLMKSRKTHQLAAIKIFYRQAKGHAVEHFDREALTRIRHVKEHPYIVRMFSAEITRNLQCWIHLEYCDGGTLSEQIRRFQCDFRMPVPDYFVLQVFIQLGEALAYVHHGLRYVGADRYAADAKHQGLIHGDLKPDNILLRLPKPDDPLGLPTIVLADFGMAQLASESHRYCGTRGWFSPEVKAGYEGVRNAPPMAKESDVYVFGLIMYRLMSERQWRTGDNADNMTLPDYEHLGWTNIISACVRVDMKRRPVFTTDGYAGLLPIVDAARFYRDKLIQERGKPGAHYYKRVR